MYVKIADGAVDTFPYYINNLKTDNPNTSFPKTLTEDTLASYGTHKVIYAQQPDIDITTHKIVTSTEPSLVDDVWTMTCTSQALTTDEQAEVDSNAAIKNRNLRDSKLSETDWWASSDLTMTSAQTTYRQALRDIPTHSNWPHLADNDWPTKP